MASSDRPRPARKRSSAAFSKKYSNAGKQAWGDYIATKIVAQTINELKTAESPKIIEGISRRARNSIF